MIIDETQMNEKIHRGQTSGTFKEKYFGLKYGLKGAYPAPRSWFSPTYTGPSQFGSCSKVLITLP